MWIKHLNGEQQTRDNVLKNRVTKKKCSFVALSIDSLFSVFQTVYRVPHAHIKTLGALGCLFISSFSGVFIFWSHNSSLLVFCSLTIWGKWNENMLNYCENV